MAINTLIIGYLLYSAIKLKKQGVRSKNPDTNKQKVFRQIFGFLFMSLNLGLTWSLFCLYIHRTSSVPQVFSYLFIVVNASQVRIFIDFSKVLMDYSISGNFYFLPSNGNCFQIINHFMVQIVTSTFYYKQR